jgi:hypothetical protein
MYYVQKVLIIFVGLQKNSYRGSLILLYYQHNSNADPIFNTIQFLALVTKKTLMNTDLISIGKEKKIQTGGQTNIKANIIMSLTPLPVQASPPRHSSFR